MMPLSQRAAALSEAGHNLHFQRGWSGFGLLNVQGLGEGRILHERGVWGRSDSERKQTTLKRKLCEVVCPRGEFVATRLRWLLWTLSR